MATYTHSSQLLGAPLKEGDRILINGKMLVVTEKYLYLNDPGHSDFCKSIPDLHKLARQYYSDQSDMDGDFPQYTNLEDAAKLVYALMRRCEGGNPIVLKEGDTFRVKSLEQIHKIISDGDDRGWTGGSGMRALCGNAFKINSMSGEFAYIGGFGVHKDFIERVPADDATKSAQVPRYATEDGASDPLTDAAPRRTSEWIPHPRCDGDPVPEKKKPRIQFSKIR